MGRIVGRTKLACKETSEGLHLIATCEKSKFLGISLADLR